MNKNLAEIVKEALAHIGCGPHVMRDIDAHLPIVFHFNNGLQIYLTIENEIVWLGAHLAEYTDKLIEDKGGALLRLLMPSIPFFVTGHLFLSHEDNYLLLCGQVSEVAINDATQFATSLQLFFDVATQSKKVIGEA